jgi:2-succinyl-6-hydroxy-2,4-cyclohexadiene-1-carboxylate synthase
VPESVVLLHGFSGTRHAWDGVVSQLDHERYLPLALDLPGHGDAWRAPAAITFASCVAHVLACAPARFTLCGYSLGGRVALHVALAAPARVGRLLLVSCSPGIEDPRERAARRESDERLARELEQRPYEEFVERWRSQPLFKDEPAAVGELARADQRRNRPQALAAVLRGLGTGQMQPLWARLGELSMPSVVVVGERDAKYVALAERMTAALPRGEMHVLAGGHGLPLECPAELARVIATDRSRPRSLTVR